MALKLPAAKKPRLQAAQPGFDGLTAKGSLRREALGRAEGTWPRSARVWGPAPLRPQAATGRHSGTQRTRGPHGRLAPHRALGGGGGL